MLQLNFNIEGADARLEYIQEYTQSALETGYTFSEAELSKMADYLLWADKPSNVKLASKWSDTTHIESLDALIESPTFNESEITSTPYSIPKTALSRAAIRETAPPDLLPHFEQLWHDIDTLELTITLYELHHKLRTTEPRPALLSRFTPSEISTLTQLAHSISQKTYLSKRHDLVDLRTSQYMLKDGYTTPIRAFNTLTPEDYTPPLFDADIPVYPLGLYNSKPLWHNPNPNTLTDSDLAQISSLLWSPRNSELFFDFTNPSHLASLVENYHILNDSTDPLSTLPQFISTFEFYLREASLSPLLLDILEYRKSSRSNDYIAYHINRTYNHHYTSNYVSTLYYQKVLRAIADAAIAHLDLASNLMFPENFKQCRDCKRYLLRTPQNFIRKAKSLDGFGCRCKKCQKLKRTNS